MSEDISEARYMSGLNTIKNAKTDEDDSVSVAPRKARRAIRIVEMVYYLHIIA